MSLGATLMFSGGTHTLGSGTTLTGDGTIIVSGGTTAIGAPISVVSITQSGGTLAGDNDLTVSGTYTWTGGTQSGTGETILASGSQMNIAGSVTAGRPIDNTQAPINWTSGLLSGSLENRGTLNVTANNNTTLVGTLANEATGMIVVTGTNFWRFGGGALTNAAGGIVDLQADADFILVSGSPTIANAGTFKKSGERVRPRSETALFSPTPEPSRPRRAVSISQVYRTSQDPL